MTLSRASVFDERHVSEVPSDPGVYLLLGTRGVVNFVGKSDTDLRARLRSMLRAGTVPASTFRYQVIREPDIREARQQSLVREHTPRYNAA